jgi:kynureninase
MSETATNAPSDGTSLPTSETGTTTSGAPAGEAPHTELLAYRERFPILETTTYLISNSLGAMPREVHEEVERFASTWETRGVKAWSEGWWEMPVTTGDLLAPLLGVAPGHVSLHQNVSLAAAIFFSCFDYPPERNRIVYTELNFPSVMYVAEGERARGAEIVTVPSEDGIGVPVERLLEAIDERTRLVPISHTYFRSAYVQDAEAVARRCREVGAVLLLDTYQSAGTVPLRLEEWGVDAAVGGSVKWLCGGPGVTYLWVRPELAGTLHPRVTGWQADEEPFCFRPGEIRHTDGPWRFLTGTPNIPALYACRPGYRTVAEIGAGRIRERSLALTTRLMDAAEDTGFEVRTPRDPRRRGGTVSVWHPEAESLCQELLARDILCDFRPGAGIRFSPHFYNTEVECDEAIRTLAVLARSESSRG